MLVQYAAKAIVAFVMALLTWLSLKYGVNLGLDETTVSAIVTALLGATPIAVFMTKNGAKPE